MDISNGVRHYLSPSGIRLTVADGKGAVEEARAIHHLPPVATVIMGKVLLGSALLATDFKNHEGVSLKWITGSPLGTIHADAYEGRYVRGYVDAPESTADLPENEVNEQRFMGGKGQLFVTRYSLLRRPYTSTVDLHHQEAAACLTEYLNTSEQVLSAMGLAVRLDEKGLVSDARGFLAQLMPGGEEKEFHRLFDGAQKDLFTDGEGSLFSIIEKESFTEIGRAPLSFQCTCSEDRIRASLTSLPPDERESLLTDESIEIVCHYCGRVYHIDRPVLKQWFSEEKGGSVQ